MMNFLRRSMNRSEKLIDDDTGSRSPDLPQWSHPAPTSPITGRAIRPLPARSLRSRLSNEQRQTIAFPPVPPSSSPLFESPFSHFGRTLSQTIRSTETNITPAAPVSFEHEFGADGAQSSLGSEEEVEEVKQPSQDYYPNKMMRNPLKGKTHSPGSSVDDHDGMENYNNKKKRKVPANRDVDPGLPADVGGTAASTTEGDGNLAGNAASGVGVSGPGRGRNNKASAKAPKERQPLANATTHVNASVNANNCKFGNRKFRSPQSTEIPQPHHLVSFQTRLIILKRTVLSPKASKIPKETLLHKGRTGVRHNHMRSTFRTPLSPVNKWDTLPVLQCLRKIWIMRHLVGATL